MRSIILASASPRRKKLFELMNIPVTIKPSTIDEKIMDGLSHDETVCSLAEQKGTDVAASTSNAIVISADTIVVHQNSILGKPKNDAEAAFMLKKLSGTSHFVYSGVFIKDINGENGSDTTISFFERTKVTFSSLDDFEIERYIVSGSPMDKAGAYGIQDDLGCLFVKRIEGDYYNVVGFPVNAFYQTLKRDFPKLFRQIF